MRKMILFTLAVLCAARCAGATAEPALYRATGEGGGICYVFGTIHVGTEKDAEAMLAQLTDKVPHAAIIGYVTEQTDCALRVI